MNNIVHDIRPMIVVTYEKNAKLFKSENSKF